jgi:hypothetical protein
MMNERIKELAEQAGLRFTQLMSNPMVPVVDGRETDLAKFAELIIGECIDIVQNLSPGYDDYRNQIEDAFRRDCVEEIKQHFGIEERKGWVCPKCGVDRTRSVCPKGHTAAITGDCPMTATAQSGVEE